MCSLKKKKEKEKEKKEIEEQKGVNHCSWGDFVAV